MSNYQIMCQLITNLSPFEKKKTKTLIVKASTHSAKLERLFELVSVKQITDQETLIKKLYTNLDKASSDSFRKLCERMILKIESVVIDAENFEVEKRNYSDIFLKRVLVKRNLLLFQVLKIKSLPNEWYVRLLEKMLGICKEYEFVEEEISCQRLLFQFYILLGDAAKILLHKNEIEVRSVHLKYLNQSEFYLYIFIDSVQHKSIDDKSKIEEMSNAVIELDKYFSESNLNTINFNKLLLEVQLAHYKEEYTHAEILMYKLVSITEGFSALRYRYKIAQNYMNLAYTQFYLSKFNEAYSNSIKAAEVYKDLENNLNLYREASVFALIYLKRYAEAEERLKTIIDSGSLGNSPEQLSKRHLMMGFIKYLEGDFKRAFMHLQETKEVESDREGWNMGIRILNIYLTLSTEKVDLADQRINAMRKHIERTARMRNLRKRDLIIFRILSHLSRSGFDFSEVWEERQKDFQLLRSDLSDYRWVPRSHELIIFDQWFEAKVLGKPYDPHFPGPKANTKRLENSTQGG